MIDKKARWLRVENWRLLVRGHLDEKAMKVFKGLGYKSLPDVLEYREIE